MRLSSSGDPLANFRPGPFASARMAFRCAPGHAVALALADGLPQALAPLEAIAAAALIDSALALGAGGSPTGSFIALVPWLALSGFRWIAPSIAAWNVLRVGVSLRKRYRPALARVRASLDLAAAESPDGRDLCARAASDPENRSVLPAFRRSVELVFFCAKATGLLLMLSAYSPFGAAALALSAALALAFGIRGGKRHYEAERDATAKERLVEAIDGCSRGREAAAERNLFGAFPRLAALSKAAFAFAYGIRVKARKRWYASAYTGNIVSQLAWIGTMLAMIPPLVEGKASPGTFIALTQAFTNLDIVWGLMNSVHGVAADRERERDLAAMLALPRRAPAREGPRGERRKGPARVELLSLSFTYPGAGSRALSDLSLALEPGRLYALVGPNGAGKTTLTRTLCGLWSPESGKALVDGVDVAGMDEDERAAAFSVVYQDFARYQASLRDNVAVGRNGADVEAGIRAAGLEALVAGLPRGLDTQLGRLDDGAVELSGGEWQRIAIARALALPAAVRILDEPAASLDPIAERRLYEDFAEVAAGATTILVTHRLGAAKDADAIAVLDGGRLVEFGDHASLMRSDGLYRHMYDSQRWWYA
jgi:ABC-type multidrug transport system fused ATPase/permease subunit